MLGFMIRGLKMLRKIDIEIITNKRVQESGIETADKYFEESL